MLMSRRKADDGDCAHPDAELHETYLNVRDGLTRHTGAHKNWKVV
ncbi:hypothetical protein VCRA2128O305_20257 [Vibrio crassostreae]|uniref:Uncharacterized protein n=1 Tax=Vibrio crassostreae TaxID=246167 RepID=A0A822MTM6_9VIBR|nr:hypothetical protein VCRA2111O320_140024 [Vibrio crassostreae]CAK1775143.1 hypothetical protein VCRA2113O324_150024 [Vibrio crassostreae]CAK1847683.1 hypothetical protein VCRA2110O173_10246 [Vibrio crassostreae]CAK1857760.1 hypothetical protein VCRA2110O175_10281 [Vibrio crassostreae]CAK1860059.1 hypothetical protein VCRA2113O221_10275 [Vibrio crassostreae]